jgi:hypothetical protein
VFVRGQSSIAKEGDTCVTFLINDEDHTLGNALRYIIMKKYAHAGKSRDARLVSTMLTVMLNPPGQPGHGVLRVHHTAPV